MPLTPRFDISQSDTEVLVKVFVPTVRITNIEVLLEESILHFFASPYLLKLNFSPHEFAPDAQGIVSARYNPSAQTVEIPLVKSQPNVEWPNLDLTARLMQPKTIPDKWLHSVEDTTTSTTTSETVESSEDVQDDNGKNASLDHLQSIGTANTSIGYGFGNMYRNIFTDYCRSGMSQEMLQLPDPETTAMEDRRDLRISKEIDDFDPDRYLQDMDLQEDYLFPMVMEYVPFWKQTKKSKTTTMTKNEEDKKDDELVKQFEKQLQVDDKTSTTTSVFTSDEKLQLSTIPYPLIPKELLEGQHHPSLWYGMLDILVPFVYDHLTTMGDPSVESAWTITILSSSLSWLDTPQHSIEDAIITPSRRMLMYPYWRNFEFALHVWNHVIDLLKEGRHQIIKAFLQIRNILEKSEFYYVGNKLFIDPYLFWIQNLDSAIFSKELDSLVSSLERILLKSSSEQIKSMMGLDLQRYEAMLEESDDEDGSDSEDDEESSDEESEADDSSVDTESTGVNDPKSEPEELIECIQNLAVSTEEGKAVDTTSTSHCKKSEAEPKVSNALLDSNIGQKSSLLLNIVEESADSNKKGNCSEQDVPTASPRPLIQEMD